MPLALTQLPHAASNDFHRRSRAKPPLTELLARAILERFGFTNVGWSDCLLDRLA